MEKKLCWCTWDELERGQNNMGPAWEFTRYTTTRKCPDNIYIYIYIYRERERERERERMIHPYS